MNRREFFSAGAGAVAAIPALAKEQPEEVKGSVVNMKGFIWGMPMPSGIIFVSHLPELELGHSARMKIMRYPGAKWVMTHYRDVRDFLPENDPNIYKVCYMDPVITNCDMRGTNEHS